MRDLESRHLENNLAKRKGRGLGIKEELAGKPGTTEELGRLRTPQRKEHTV